MEFKQVITWMDIATIIFSFLTMLFVGYNFVKNRKQFDKIEIIFKVLSTKQEITIDKNLTRKDCKRSEIQGILRTKLTKEARTYNINYIGTDEYFENIYQIQIAKSDYLYIELGDDELSQFGLK
jgi:hypothetical protein